MCNRMFTKMQPQMNNTRHDYWNPIFTTMCTAKNVQITAIYVIVLSITKISTYLANSLSTWTTETVASLSRDCLFVSPLSWDKAADELVYQAGWWSSSMSIRQRLAAFWVGVVRRREHRWGTPDDLQPSRQLANIKTNEVHNLVTICLVSKGLQIFAYFQIIWNFSFKISSTTNPMCGGALSLLDNGVHETHTAFEAL